VRRGASAEPGPLAFDGPSARVVGFFVKTLTIAELEVR